MEPIFKGLRVIDLSTVLAGPSVGMFLAELGATVIKIENPVTGGDVTRTWRGAGEMEQEGVPTAYFSSVNWGKEFITANLNAGEDRNKLIELLKSADIVLVNFKPGDAEKFGLTFTDVERINPRIIYGSITGFGENDPRVAYDLILQAESGLMSINGEPNGPPLKMPVAFIDVLAAHQLKEGILIALLERERSGKGKKVSVSLFDAAVASLVNQGANYLFTKKSPGRMGSLHPNIAPYGETFLLKDGSRVVLAIGSDKQFAALCKLLGDEKVSTDPRFLTNPLRVKNRTELGQILAPLLERADPENLLRSSVESGVPLAKIRSIGEVIEGLPPHFFLIFGQNGQKIIKSVVF